MKPAKTRKQNERVYHTKKIYLIFPSKKFDYIDIYN